MLPNHPWKISYSSNENNPILDFYIPALENACQYDRKSGFFSSAILSRVAAGLGALLQNQGKMRLIMGCYFSPQDLAAIQKGYDLRDALNHSLESALTPPQTLVQLKHFEILSWLIEHGYLDIKIAIPLKKDGVPESPTQQLDPHHIFHEKVGIFTDAQFNQLVCFGSNNESLSGWEQNIESFHVYCSWEGERDAERVNEEVFRFEQLWNDHAPQVKLFDVPEAVQAKLLRYLPRSQPMWDVHQEFDTRPLPPQEESKPDQRAREAGASYGQQQSEFSDLINLHQQDGCLAFCLQSIPIEPWPHQFKILRRVAATFPRSFLIADEVGLGKTIETGLILRYLLVSQKVKRVLILVPASVQPQWQEELRDKFNLHFWSYSQGEFKDPYGRGGEEGFNREAEPPGIHDLAEPSHEEGGKINPWNRYDLVLASSHLVRRQERRGELLDAEPWDLIILDEAHHARRKTPKARKDTPNSLLKLMQQLRTQTTALILLSATPMQIDPIEVFDLLALLGLPGHWRYGDSFCDYFMTLGEQLNPMVLEFWQRMAVDYFRSGGKPCDRLEQYFKQQNRLLSYKLRDIWQNGKTFVDGKQLCQDQAFIEASRQYLTTNTPLKDLMFRHTRETLRQYYRRGLLERDIPQRFVQDNAIGLEGDREIPLYQAVSDYVRNFYRLAQKQDRKALGFLMTLYRKRLTSSFYAIQESLKRRLAGISLTDDDLVDVDEADEAVIQGLERYMEPVDPKEIEYLETLLRQFENTGEDSKLLFLMQTLRAEFLERESAIIFTQYTDTMDYLRAELRSLYGDRLACYSGRGGELPIHNPDPAWQVVPKEEIKRRFRQGEIQILLCTESASEGLNLQTCGVLINYDLPWNPMRVEQRIGRLDRIGQRYPTVKIHNFYYDGTVEAKVYKRLRERIGLFTSIVGNLQPILAQVPTFIEQATMSADPQEEDVLMAEFEAEMAVAPVRPSLNEMVEMDVEADLAELRTPLAPAPLSWQEIETAFTQSQRLRSHGFNWVALEGEKWQLSSNTPQYPQLSLRVTFNPAVFGADPGLRLMSFGDPVFEGLLAMVGE